MSHSKTEIFQEPTGSGSAMRQSTLATSLVRAEQFACRRLAAILQDELQQLLYGVRLMLRLAHDALDSGQSHEAGRMLRQADALLLRSTQVTRELSVELNPPILRNEGLKSILAWLRRQMRERHGLDVELEGDDVQVDDDAARWLLFRVLHELLFNAANRSGARRASVVVQDAVEALSVEVADDGAGFDPAAAEEDSRGALAAGIASARERIGLLGGRLDVESSPESGMRVRVWLPRRAALGH